MEEIKNKKIESKLFDVSARLEVLSGILNGLYNAALNDRSTALLEGDGYTKMRDWLVSYYDLLSSAVWEVSTALDEQQIIIADCIKEL